MNKKKRLFYLLLLSITIYYIDLFSQVVNPADKQKGGTKDVVSSTESKKRYLSVEIPAVEVLGHESPYKEEERIGDYLQPRWTAHRRFPTTRIFVVPKGYIEFEYWHIMEIPRKGDTKFTTQYEVEFGLPHRFQLDLYLVSTKQGNLAPFSINQQKFELRYAFADWGKIFANPTLYLEWVQRDKKADKAEVKLLLGGELSAGWHWGTNFVFEHELGGKHENEYELTAGISKILSDTKFSLGAELKASIADVHGSRGNFEEKLLIGPSLQYRPLPYTHIDFAPLIGVTKDSPKAQIWFVFGWEF